MPVNYGKLFEYDKPTLLRVTCGTNGKFYGVTDDELAADLSTLTGVAAERIAEALLHLRHGDSIVFWAPAPRDDEERRFRDAHPNEAIAADLVVCVREILKGHTLRSLTRLFHPGATDEEIDEMLADPDDQDDPPGSNHEEEGVLEGPEIEGRFGVRATVRAEECHFECMVCGWTWKRSLHGLIPDALLRCPMGCNHKAYTGQ